MSLLSDFAADTDRVTAYRSWLKRPDTKEYLGLVSEVFLRPVLPGAIGHPISRQSSSFCLGENAGSWKIFDGIQTLDTIQAPKQEEPREVYNHEEGK